MKSKEKHKREILELENSEDLVFDKIANERDIKSADFLNHEEAWKYQG